MKNERTADKVINGTVHIYSDELDEYLPLYTEENNLTYKLDRKTMTYIPMIELEKTSCDIGFWGRKKIGIS